MSATPILEARKVSRHFGKFKALNNVSVSFLAGELTAIIGPNDAGKSTFFSVISGGVPPRAGQVLHHGELLVDGNPDEIGANAEVKRVHLGQS